MDSKENAGYREIEHTADWELEVWAPDLPGLMGQAARGMYALAGMRLAPGPGEARYIELLAADAEIMLVSFLSELLYLSEREGIGFETFNVSVEGDRLQAQVSGGRLAGLDKEIKAVTYHNLQVRQGPNGFEARVVLDV